MNLSDEIERLKKLHERGVLSDEEFTLAKERVLKGAGKADFHRHNFWRSYRKSVKDKWFGGVCGGLGEITPAPSWVWRVLFCFSVCFAGIGILLYLLLWMFAPAAENN